MEPATPPPPRTRRVMAARAALAVLALVALELVTLTVADFSAVAALLLTLVVVVAVGAASAWWAITTHRTWKRRLNLGVLGAGALLLAAAIVRLGAGNLIEIAIIGLTGLLFGFFAARALRVDPVLTDPGPPAAERPVLIINPRSGDGTAGRTGLAAAASDLGIEVAEL